MVDHSGFLLGIVAAVMAIIIAYVHKSDNAVLIREILRTVRRHLKELIMPTPSQ